MNDFYILSELGIDEIAYSYEAAIMKIRSYIEQRIPILGGDVFILLGDSPTPTDDSWYCEQKANEPYIDYVNRSGKIAIDYINMYVSGNYNHVLFSIVI